jgi:hypothetical protein
VTLGRTDEFGFAHDSFGSVRLTLGFRRTRLPAEFGLDALPESWLGPPWGPRAARSGLAADQAPLYQAHNALPYQRQATIKLLQERLGVS